MVNLQLIARGLRDQPNLLFTFPTVAGVQWLTSWRLGRESELFVCFYVLAPFLKRPRCHPLHAASGAFPWSKPVRPHSGRLLICLKNSPGQGRRLASLGGSQPFDQGSGAWKYLLTRVTFPMKMHQPGKASKDAQDRGRTNPPGQNPKQNDAVDHDLYNDEGRINPLAEKSQKSRSK
jgi:hypothetical protein